MLEECRSDAVEAKLRAVSIPTKLAIDRDRRGDDWRPGRLLNRPPSRGQRPHARIVWLGANVGEVPLKQQGK